MLCSDIMMLIPINSQTNIFRPLDTKSQVNRVFSCFAFCITTFLPMSRAQIKPRNMYIQLFSSSAAPQAGGLDFSTKQNSVLINAEQETIVKLMNQQNFFPTFDTLFMVYMQSYIILFMDFILFIFQLLTKFIEILIIYRLNIALYF